VRPQTIPDSILISLVAVAFSLGSVVLLSTPHLPLGDETAYLAVGPCGAPLVAMMNVVFIVRDYRTGREDAAQWAAMLSLGAVFIGALPVLLAD
jgi:hypothetical protein